MVSEVSDSKIQVEINPFDVEVNPSRVYVGDWAIAFANRIEDWH
jgi:hypothetical protein